MLRQAQHEDLTDLLTLRLSKGEEIASNQFVVLYTGI